MVTSGAPLDGVDEMKLGLMFNSLYGGFWKKTIPTASSKHYRSESLCSLHLLGRSTGIISDGSAQHICTSRGCHQKHYRSVGIENNGRLL